MKKWIYIFGFVIVILTSCKDDEVAIFDKTADERVAEAIATLKQDLVAPANGWRVKVSSGRLSQDHFMYCWILTKTTLSTLKAIWVAMMVNSSNRR